MTLLLNIVFAVIAYLIADNLFAKAKVEQPIRVILAVLVALLVFFANIAERVF